MKKWFFVETYLLMFAVHLLMSIILASAATCGNGAVETGEECDDGNIVYGDGCSGDCKDEPWCMTYYDGIPAYSFCHDCEKPTKTIPNGMVNKIIVNWRNSEMESSSYYLKLYLDDQFIGDGSPSSASPTTFGIQNGFLVTQKKLRLTAPKGDLGAPEASTFIDKVEVHYTKTPETEICNDNMDNDCNGKVDDVDSDTSQCCQSPNVWEQNTNNNLGACCGDDVAGDNPMGTIKNSDDPDWGQATCRECHGEIGLPLQDRIWDASSNKCCGDDANDDPDMGQDSCTSCKIGYFSNDTSKRVWESTIATPKCCGDDLNDDADMGILACTGCPVGQNAENPSLRIWDLTSNTCCGDDVNDDPDVGATACSNCPIGMNANATRVYDPQLGCCGDDQNDCGLIGGGNLCSMDENNTNPQLYVTDPIQAGEIVNVSCNGYQYLGTESAWQICDSEWIIDVNGHEYICVI